MATISGAKEMQQFTRRGSLIMGAGAVAGATLAGGRAARAAIQTVDAKAPDLAIEKGATLRVLRPTKFVEPDQTVFLENSKRFSDETGVPVKVDFAGWEDIRPQTAVSANVGGGPDLIIGWGDDPHLYADKLVDLGDIADYLGKKYGGWYPLAEKLGREKGTGKWIGLPMGGSGGPMVYRSSWVKEAGFEQPPADLDGFLELCQKLKENGHPAGFALGHAVGDANGFCHWLVWAHGGFMVDESNNVTINSPETVAALKYAKALYETFIPGTLAWQDTSNNKALASGELGLTQNGVSLYFSIKNSQDAATQAVAADLNHARMPIGPAGRPTETALVINAMLFEHAKYPNAAKAYLQFMMEEAQYDKWLTACLGYWAQPLKAYADSDVWQSDPKILPYRDTMETSLWYGYKGDITEASGAVVADYVMVDMVASVCSGQATAEEAAAEAERRAKRYYKG
jgi:multiple sugar transport system substrate-binding protein